MSISIQSKTTRAATFDQQGYLVLEDALTSRDLDALRAEATAICRGQRGAIPGVQASDDKEPDASVLARYLCIHHPHKCSPVMAAYIAHPPIVDVLCDLIGPNVKCMQSMLFVKAAGKPGQAWHQDECYIPTRDRSLTAAWTALDDATIENGCLWVIPGSHQPGILWAMRENADPEFDCNDESHGFPYADTDGVPVEVAAGSAVFFNGYLLHRSLRNTALSGFRRSFVSHYMSAESLLPWRRPPDDVFIAQHDYRDVILVAGRDPYAYKGLETLAKTHVRPENLGGCRPEDAVKRY